jgi:hypothetical protein
MPRLIYHIVLGWFCLSPILSLGLNVSLDITSPISCNGANDGALATIVTGNAGPVIYLWSNSDTTASIAGLGPGTYSVTVGDSLASVTVSITLSEPSPLTATAIAISESCGGADDGSVELVASGGTPPYQYREGNTGPFQSGSTFSNLVPNAYSFIVRDDRGCQITLNATVNSVASLVIDSVFTISPSCAGGGNDGGLTILASGGSTPYQYQVDGGTLQSSPVFNNLTAGSHNLSVQDANGCTANGTAFIDAAGTILVNTLLNPTICANDIGSISVTASGGNPPYEYQLRENGTNVILVPYQASSNFNNLMAGTYDVMVRGSNNCISIASNLSIVKDSVEILSVQKTDADCAGVNNGSAIFTPSGGTAPYTYLLDGVTVSNFAFQNLSAGIYPFAVTDAGGCTDTASVNITEPAPLSIDNLITSPTDCGLSNGTIQVSASGGSGTYQYNTSGGVGFQGSNLLSGLGEGFHTVLVRDANAISCQVSRDTSIVPTTTLDTTNVQLVDIACFGDSTGQITFQLTGGIGPFTVRLYEGFGFSQGLDTALISGTQAADFQNLPAGTYSLEVEDASSCVLPLQFSLDQPAQPLSNFVSVNSSLQIPCFLGTTGEIRVDVGGGTPGYLHQLFLNGNPQGPAQGSPVFPGLGEGLYTVLTTDFNGCSDTFLVELTAPLQPDSVSYLPVDLSVCNEQDSIRFRGTGKFANATFADNQAYLGPNGEFKPQFPNLTSSLSFSVFISGNDTTVNACAFADTIAVSVNPRPVASFAAPLDSLFCQNTTEDILVRGSPGDTVMSLRDLDGNGLTGNLDSTIFLPQQVGIGPQTFRYVIEDSLGCRDTAFKKVFVLPQPRSSMAYDRACEETQATFWSTSSLNPAFQNSQLQSFFNDNSLNYEILDTAARWLFRGIVEEIGDTVQHTFPLPGQAIVRLRDTTSMGGCVSETDSIIRVGALPRTELSWENACLGDTTQFFDLTPPLEGVEGDSMVGWFWDFGDGATDSVPNSEHVYATTFANRQVELITVTSLNCSDTARERVYILPVVTGFPYEQGFEANDGEWVSVGGNELWQWRDLPATPFADGGKGWFTDAPGDRYPQNTDAFLFTACFDLKNMARPAMALKRWSDSETDDGTVLQVLFTGSPTRKWQNVGSINAEGVASGLAWYNSESIFAQPGQVGQGLGWTGRDSVWRISRHKLDALQDSGKVRFRLAFAADDREDTTAIARGFALDSLWIGERDRSSVVEVFGDGTQPVIRDFSRRLQENNPQDLVVVQYPWTDSPFYEQNPAPPRARSLYYGVNHDVEAVLDGNAYNDRLFGLDQTTIDRRVLQASPFEVVFDTTANESIILRYQGEVPILEEIWVSVIVAERFQDELLVVRKMLPDPGGYSFFTWPPNFEVKLAPLWEAAAQPDPSLVVEYDSLAVIVLVQEQESKEVLQAAISPIWSGVLDPGLVEREASPLAPNAWQVYPNPTRGLLTLEFPQLLTKGSEALIYDMQGRVVMRQRLKVEVNQEELDLKALGKGVYQLEVRGLGDQVWRERVVVY